MVFMGRGFLAEMGMGEGNLDKGGCGAILRFFRCHFVFLILFNGYFHFKTLIRMLRAAGNPVGQLGLLLWGMAVAVCCGLCW